MYLLKPLCIIIYTYLYLLANVYTKIANMYFNCLFLLKVCNYFLCKTFKKFFLLFCKIIQGYIYTIMFKFITSLIIYSILQFNTNSKSNIDFVFNILKA